MRQLSNVAIAGRDDTVTHNLRLGLDYIDMEAERLFANSRTVLGFNSHGNHDTVFISRARLASVA
jgi:hypothetical protein